ncbi:hypothetical protein l13_17770 [Neisseria weaveri ATCC 51223]|nr:hypothetical protein l13_17770 [Neisseria weaveri ATCC 51223]
MQLTIRVMAGSLFGLISDGIDFNGVAAVCILLRCGVRF